jgi:signal transduction histidine kinase
VTPVAARRLAWAIAAVAASLAALALLFLAMSWREPLPAGTFGFRGFALLFVATFGVVGILITRRQPENPIGWLFLLGALVSAIQELAQSHAIYAAGRPGAAFAELSAWIPAWIWIPGTATIMFVLLLFPDGHLLSPGWRWVAWLGAIGIVVSSLALALAPGPLENFETIDNPFAVDALGFLGRGGSAGLSVYGVPLTLAGASIVVRFRRSSGEERQQLTWLAASGVVVTAVLTVSFIGEAVVTNATAYLWLSVLVIAAFLSVPIAIAIAVLRYRLYDIDIVISKAVVYGALALFITLVYVAIVVGVGAAVERVGDALLSAIAAAIVALAFQPVRRWAQRLANRVVYGERATPYEVLSQLSSRFAGTYSLEDALPRLARVIVEAIGAERADVWRWGDGRYVREASSPGEPGPDEPADPDRLFEIRHQGDLLGAISVRPRATEPLGPPQEKLLADVAAQAGLMLRNVALVEDLRDSRKRIVAAQDERARKLERDLHDGAQQQLVALAVKLRLADSLVGRDDERAHAVLADLGADANDALETLRDLARGIYPPLLADRGLTEALRAQARKAPLPVEVRGDDIGRYPQETEAAVYFCVLEALQNAGKYAEASVVTVSLAQRDGQLTFEVIDDGRGFDPEGDGHGTGLQGMADRLAALGGSLEVSSEPGRGATITGRIGAEAIG